MIPCRGPIGDETVAIADYDLQAGWRPWGAQTGKTHQKTDRLARSQGECQHSRRDPGTGRRVSEISEGKTNTSESEGPVPVFVVCGMHGLLSRLSSHSHRERTKESLDADSYRPPASMTPGPLPVVRNEPGADVEEDCIICGESLSFSFRLPGEKPHIVPECGHALHEACFTAVYGQVNQSRMGALPRKNLGVCGVCRKPIRVGDGDGAKSNKLAALTGMGENATSMFPGREQTSGPLRYTPTPRAAPTPAPHDPTDDDPLEPPTNASVRSGGSASSDYVVAPSISVRSEFPSITRTHEPTQSITCLITVELPSRRGSAPYQVRSSQPRSDMPLLRPPMTHLPRPAKQTSGLEGSPDGRTRPITNVRHSVCAPRFACEGVLRILFKEAIICVLEEKKKTLGRLLQTGSGAGSFDGSSLASGATSPGPFGSKSVLRLKGRIYIRHIKRLLDTSVAGELSLTIDMEDERLESFILIFRDHSSLENWRATIQGLVNAQRAANNIQIQDLVEFGGAAQAGGKGTRARSAATTASSIGADSLLHSGQRSTLSSTASSAGGGYPSYSKSPEPYVHVAPMSVPGHQCFTSPAPWTNGRYAVVSLPPPSANPSTAQLKHRGPIRAGHLPSRQVRTVRKTPFLSIGRPGSVTRLSGFIESMANPPPDNSDEFSVTSAKDEIVDVVTAVNHGTGHGPAAKKKNSISGMVLVCDASDTSRKPQMDLLMARTEAASLRSIRLGTARATTPDCLAGCVGGMMSIGVMNLRMHAKVLDHSRFRIKKVAGVGGAVVASSGLDVDVTLPALRFGERRELIVELELDNPHGTRDRRALAFGCGAWRRMMDAMIDEAPVFEVDGGFFDPAQEDRDATGPSCAPHVGDNPKRADSAATVVGRIDSTCRHPDGPHEHPEHVAPSSDIPNDEKGAGDAGGGEGVRAEWRPFGAQQAMVFRDQLSWTGRTTTEKIFWCADHSIELFGRSSDWAASS
ncbi:Pleckstrin homology domain [Rhizoctonia solani]|uniref:Pleckstrin homology domain n=1 Tax=Rhizoctonia solani TaxID=456999 RepID=A0A8H7IAX4_9AGAM|nr:Pleckstrin homology domain [Rhizoctonia solani]